MNMPKSFKAELTKRKRKEEKERLDEIKEEKQYQQKLKKHKEGEKSKHKSKVEICKKLFAWKEEFLKTEEGARIFKRSNNDLWVFGGNWAHEVPQYSGYGCWSRIYFTDAGLEYKSGYKWMGFRECFTFKKPEDMAKKLNYKYLKEFLTQIDNKKIYKYILELNND